LPAACARYDRAQHERFIDEVIAAFPLPMRGATPAGATEEAADAGAVQPIFVCGMCRSGSTLVEQILSGHPDIASGGEPDFLPALVRDDLSPYPQAVSPLKPRAARDIAARYVDLLTRPQHAVNTASVWQVRQPLYQHASGRARRFAPHLDRLAEYLGLTRPR
jgi:hypothetical protein